MEAHKLTTNIKIPVRVHAALKSFALGRGYKLEWLVETSIREFLEHHEVSQESEPAPHRPHPPKQNGMDRSFGLPPRKEVEVAEPKNERSEDLKKHERSEEPKREVKPIPEQPKRERLSRAEEIRRKILKDHAKSLGKR